MVDEPAPASEPEELGEPPSVPHSRIDALVRLLGDDDEKILAVAWDELEKVGGAALPVLREATRTCLDERVRIQARRFLLEWERREVFREWIRFCREQRFDLEDGALLIARTEDPRCDPAPYVDQLDEYASVLRRRVEKESSVEGAVRRVAQFLFEEQGFRGNSENYHDPSNSYLHRVLDRKLGIPISLAVVLLLVARRLEIPLAGVATPGHFLAKFRGGEGERFVDTFHGGRVLTLEQCARFLAMSGVRVTEEHLRPVDSRQILTRMLNNLFKVYWDADDHRRSGRVAAMLKLLS